MDDTPASGSCPLTGKPLLAIVFALLLSIALIALDQSIIATALPVIVSDFNALQDVTWVIGGYLLTVVAFTAIYGQALTIVPTKWVYVTSIAIFELGSLFCGVAPWIDFLIFGRVVAGVGAGGICTSVLTILAETTKMHHRAIVFGTIGALFSISSIVGPLLGATLTAHFSWRWCFYINLPLGVLSLAIIVFRLPLHRPLVAFSWTNTIMSAFFNMDWIGCLLCLATMVALVLSLSWSGSKGWNSPAVISSMCGWVLLLTCLILWERRKGDRGILPLRIIAKRSLIGVCIVLFFTMFNLLVLTYYIPLLYQTVYGHSPIRSGIDMLPFLLASVVTTIGSSLIVSRTGHYWGILATGPVFCCIAGGLLFSITENTSSVKFTMYQILYGIGVGTTSQNPFVALQAHSEPETISICNGIATFMQILGGLIGVTIAGSIFNGQLHHNLAVYAPDIDPGPITESVAAVYSVVPLTARAGVIHAYLKSLDCVFVMAVPAGFMTIVGAVLIKNVNLSATNNQELREPTRESSDK